MPNERARRRRSIAAAPLSTRAGRAAVAIEVAQRRALASMPIPPPRVPAPWRRRRERVERAEGRARLIERRDSRLDGSHLLALCAAIDIDSRASAAGGAVQRAYFDRLDPIADRELFRGGGRRLVRAPRAGAVRRRDRRLRPVRSRSTSSTARAVGDALAARGGERISAAIGEGDLVARFAGDQIRRPDRRRRATAAGGQGAHRRTGWRASAIRSSSRASRSCFRRRPASASSRCTMRLAEGLMAKAEAASRRPSAASEPGAALRPGDRQKALRAGAAGAEACALRCATAASPARCSPRSISAPASSMGSKC